MTERDRRRKEQNGEQEKSRKQTANEMGFLQFRLMIIWFSHLLLWIQSIEAEAKLFVFRT